jgi:hypothetical protein
MGFILPFRLIVLTMALMVTGVVVITAVLAAHVPGATYNGTHQGGGEVEFEVSQDGNGVSSFTARDVPGNTCDFTEVTVNYDPPLPITNHEFSSSSSVGLSVSGSFPQAGQAQGNLTVKQPGFPACNAFDIPWSATTDVPTTTPTPSPTPSPTPGPLKKGDVDCDGSVGSVDALKELRYVAHLPVTKNEPCPDIGTEANSIFGDMDCNNSVTSVDALKILRYVAVLPTGLPGGCAPIGE